VVGTYRVAKRRHFGLQMAKKNHPVAYQITELWVIFKIYCF